MKNLGSFLFLFLLLIHFSILISCNKDEAEQSIEVSNFRIVPLSEYAPSEVFVITESTYIGKNEYTYIHIGSDSERDTTERISISTVKMTYTDTLELNYSLPGNYTVSLEVGGKNFSDSFTLAASE